MTRTLLVPRLVAVAVLAAAGVLAVPVLSAPAAADIPNRTIVEDESDKDAVDAKGASATCPAGQRVIGTSAWIGGGGGEVRLQFIYPTSNAVHAWAIEDEDGANRQWSVGVSATCSDPLPGLQIVSRTSTVTSDPYNSVAADCTGGTKLFGMGYALGTGSGEVGIDDMKVVGDSRATMWAYEDNTGFAGNWSVTSYAICANPLPGYEVISETGSDQSDESESLAAECSTGKKIIGGGGQVDGGGGRVIVEDLLNNESRYQITGHEDDDSYSGSWHLHAYAICATDS